MNAIVLSLSLHIYTYIDYGNWIENQLWQIDDDNHDFCNRKQIKGNDVSSKMLLSVLLSVYIFISCWYCSTVAYRPLLSILCLYRFVSCRYYFNSSLQISNPNAYFSNLFVVAYSPSQ
uniref:Uncharacterized protein n=1 Tax=Pseudo-nitzschia australis TaxID=44445 RepID=A0A7S4AVQ7_9STRA